MQSERFRLPFQKPPVETPTVAEEDDNFSDPWFTADSEPTHRSAVDRLTHLLRDNPRAGSIVTLATIIAAACSSEMFQKGSANSESQALTPMDHIEIIKEAEGDLRVLFNYDESMRITSWNNREEWDQELTPEMGNQTFAWHRHVFEKQYAPFTASPILQTETEPLLMKANEYPNFTSVYGNMEIGDIRHLTELFVEDWIDAAQVLGKDIDSEHDLETLTAAEWMHVLQAPAIQLQYDKRLASIFPEYNEALTNAHFQKTIEQLVTEGVGVCRDNERINITSYVIADKMFHLADNGLLYLPATNIIDAKHTRGAFYLSQNPQEMIVVGVDTTFGDGNIEKALTVVSPTDEAIWHSQQYDKDIPLTPAARLESLKLFEQLQTDLSPTTRAILEREELLAMKEAFEGTQVKAEKSVIAREKYNTLLSIVTRDAATATFPLNMPSRLVGLFDQLLSTSRELDKLEGNPGVYQATAQTMFADYLQKNGVDADKARAFVGQIDRLPHNEREEQLEIIRGILTKK